MSDSVKVEVSIQTNIYGSKCVDTLEFDREDWESMTDQEKEAACFEFVWNMAEWNWSVKGDE